MRIRLGRFCALFFLTTLSSTAIAEDGQPVVAPKSTDGFFGRVETFSDYTWERTESDSFNRFDLRRAELGAGWSSELGGAYVNVEAIRSAGPDSFAGIDGNSLVMRVKHGFGLVRPRVGPGRVLAYAGLITDPWIRSVESGYSLRGYSALLSERGRFFDTSDLGFGLGYDLWDGFLELHWALSNGEGRNEVEQNSGKNATFVLTARPLEFALFGSPAHLGIHAAYRDGSIGVSSAQNRRIAAALTLEHDRFGGGAEFIQALGYSGVGSRDARGFGAWAHAFVWQHWFGLTARYDWLDSNIEADDAVAQTVSAGLLGDVLEADQPIRLRWFVRWVRQSVGTDAGPVPGVPGAGRSDAVMLTLEASAGPNFAIEFNTNDPET